MSISSTISQLASTNPTVGLSVANASVQSSLLSGLSGASGGGPFDNVIGALATAPSQIAGLNAAATTAAPFTAAAGAQQQAATQAAQSSALLTGLGQTVNAYA